MDRDVPPRVTYWTGVWDPAKEGISKEINALRTGPRASASVVAFSPGQPTRMAVADKVLVLSSRHWLALRAVAAIVEPRGDVTHLFGGDVSWHLLRALGRRPILLTAVVPRTGSRLPPGVNVARLVVETDASVAEWEQAGIPRERIDVVHAGVDLDWFTPQPPPTPPANGFRLLFASTPSDPGEITARGLPLLIALARQRPDIRIVVPWRAWGETASAKRILDGLRPPANFLVTVGDAVDMRAQFADVHATVAAFAPGTGKSCPNFVIEGLATGRPCIMTPEGGLSRLLDRSGAGVVAERDVTALAAAVDRLRGTWQDYSRRAREMAEREFDLRQFQVAYERIYRDLAGSASRPS
jgi:glycosyltransferase involved in cell wall biosynthesis